MPEEDALDATVSVAYRGQRRVIAEGRRCGQLQQSKRLARTRSAEEPRAVFPTTTAAGREDGDCDRRQPSADSGHGGSAPQHHSTQGRTRRAHKLPNEHARVPFRFMVRHTVRLLRVVFASPESSESRNARRGACRAASVVVRASSGCRTSDASHQRDCQCQTDNHLLHKFTSFRREVSSLLTCSIYCTVIVEP